MRLKPFLPLALTLALVIPTAALTAPLNASDEVALADKLSKYMDMYKFFHESVFRPIGQPIPSFYRNFTACRKVSAAWEAVATGSPCSSSTDCSSVTSASETPCCKQEGGQFQASNAKTCEDAPQEWRKAQTGDNSDSCCDSCLLSATTPEYKASGCSGIFTTDLVGLTVCGKIPDSDPVINIAGEPIAFRNGTSRCDTGFQYEEGALDDGQCRVTRAQIETFFSHYSAATTEFKDRIAAAYQAGNMSAVPSAARTYLGLGDKAETVAMLEFSNAVVSTVAPFTATVTLQGGVGEENDQVVTKANGCAIELLSATLNGDLKASRGHANIYKPTVHAAGTVRAYDYGDGNATSAWIMGGSNAGKVTCTATGQFYVHDLVNTGTLVATGTKDGFVSKVTNDGAATFVNVVGSAVAITNNGAIVVNGTSHVNMKLVACGPGSSVVYKAGTKGAVTAPPGCNIVTEPGANVSVTRTETTGGAPSSSSPASPATTPAPTPAPTPTAAAPKAPADTKHFVELTVTMPYTQQDFEGAAVRAAFKKAVARAAGTIADNVKIVSVTPARRRAASINVKTQILAVDVAGVAALKTVLGTGDALKTKLNNALAAENLPPSTGVTAPTTAADAASLVPSAAPRCAIAHAAGWVTLIASVLLL